MKKRIPALTRLLLPVKDYELFKKTLPLVELVSRAMADQLEKVDLLHVVGGSFMSTHLNNIDFRAGHVLSSGLMQRLRDQHYHETVDPLLTQVQELLGKSGVALQANVRVEDGDPVKKITGICDSEGYSTLIMSRRKEEESIFVGSVINGVVNRHVNASFYIVGAEGFVNGVSPAARIMVGVDGSAASLNAVREAAVVLSKSTSAIEEISLVNVLDPSCLLEEGGLNCQQLTETGYQHMQEAEDILSNAGVDKSKIVASVLYGKPSETLYEHAQSFGATMCYIGFRDRSKISEVLLGSVSGDLIHRCLDKTIVLVS